MSNDKCACGSPLVNGGCSNLAAFYGKDPVDPVDLKFPAAKITVDKDPVYGKQGEWVNYRVVPSNKEAELQKELDETKKKLADAEAKLAKIQEDDYALVKTELEKMRGKIKACADVAFIPKTD